MRSFIALVRREYLEHRGAFLYAPLILIGVVTLLIAFAFVSGHYHFDVQGSSPIGYRVFDTGYFGIAIMWGAYLFMALFFYFADAFNADRRNNQMFFWKSMPQSDFRILMSKLTAGLTILPALIYLAMLLTGVIAAVLTFLAPFALPILGMPDLGGTISAWAEVSGMALCYLVLALLWYAPFFAWVGGLSTVVGRWSIPLALLIPVVFSLFEGVADFGSAPGGSYILSFLKRRLSFEFDIGALQLAVFDNRPLDFGEGARRLVTSVDWPSLAGGLIFAVVVVYLASEYRRRVLKS